MSDSSRISRRHFLFAAGGATATATAVVVARKNSATAPPAKSKAPPVGNGYRVTEHIRSYYRTTKV